MVNSGKEGPAPRRGQRERQRAAKRRGCLLDPCLPCILQRGGYVWFLTRMTALGALSPPYHQHHSPMHHSRTAPLSGLMALLFSRQVLE